MGIKVSLVFVGPRLCGCSVVIVLTEGDERCSVMVPLHSSAVRLEPSFSPSALPTPSAQLLPLPGTRSCSVHPWKGKTGEHVDRQRQPRPSGATVAAFMGVGGKTSEEIGLVEVGWHENAWKTSVKRGPLGSIVLFLKCTIFSGQRDVCCLACSCCRTDGEANLPGRHCCD